MIEHEVVVTGAGLTTPLGIGVEANWANLKALRTGIDFYPKPGLPNCFQYFGKVRELPLPEPGSRSLAAQMKFLNRGALLGFSAAFEAAGQPGVGLSSSPPDRRALYVAAGDFTKVGYDFLYPATKEGTAGNWERIDFERLNQATLTHVNPFFLLESISNNLFSFLSAFYEIRGSNTSLASQSPYGNQALELAYRSIQQGRADAALAVGYGNWITEVPLFELEGLGLISKCDSGTSSFKPFDRLRDGFIPAEGGAALVLETADIARRRGANVLGGINGCGNAIEISTRGSLSMADRVSLRCMRLALEEARCHVPDLAFISAHGSGTQKGDRSELTSIANLMAAEKAQIPICGMKPYTGHMGAASDIAEIVLAIKAAEEGLVPATLNFSRSDEEFSELSLSNCHQPCEKGKFLSISYGLGGQSSAVVITAR